MNTVDARIEDVKAGDGRPDDITSRVRRTPGASPSSRGFHIPGLHIPGSFTGFLALLLLLLAGNFNVMCAQVASPATPQAIAQWNAWAALTDTAAEADAKGSYDIARKDYQQVLDEAQAAGNEKIIALCQEKLGITDYDIAFNGGCPNSEVLTYYGQGRDLVHEALMRFEKLHDAYRCAECLLNEGLVYHGLGFHGGGTDNYDLAVEALKQALLEFQVEHYDYGTANCLKELGIVYSDMDRWDDAIEAIHQSLDVARKHKDWADADRKETLYACYYQLAAVYDTLGRDNDALTEANRALALYRDSIYPRGVAACMNELGLIEEDFGNANFDLVALRKALRYDEQAQAIYQQLHIDSDVATCLSNKANVYTSIGLIDSDEGETAQGQADFAAAEGCANQETKIFLSLNDEQPVALSRVNLASVYFYEGDYEKARELYRQSAGVLQRGDRLQYLQCLANLGLVDSKLGRWDEANAEYVHVIKLYEDASATVDDPSQIGTFQDVEGSSVYADYADVLLNLKRPLDALAMMDRGRAQGLSRQVAGSRVDFTRLLDPSDAKQLIEKQRAATHAGSALRAAQSSGVGIDAAQSIYDAADHDLTLFRDSLLAQDRYVAYRQAKGRAAPTGAQLMTLATAHPDTLYLEWASVDDKRILLFALSKKDGLKAFRLPVLAPRLNTLMREWTRAITNTSAPEETDAARQIYQQLLGPADKAGLLAPGRYRRLVLIPDPGFAALPLAALIDGHDRRLIERFPISTDIALSTLVWPVEQPRPSGALFCAADTGSNPAERFGGASRVALAPPATVASGTAIRGSVFRAGFKPLPNAREEGRKVVALFPGSLGLAGPAAREADVKAAMPRYALLHFATHGFLDARNGLRSWLLLAPEPEGSSEDGRLEAREVAQMHLSAQMTTLSACDSGLGQQGGGDGLLGLAWGFQAAGCPSVICSLWSVDDAATSQLMDAFYKNLKSGEPKDVALQRAMLRLLKTGGPDRTSPYWWAAFQAVGDTSPLHLP